MFQMYLYFIVINIYQENPQIIHLIIIIQMKLITKNYQTKHLIQLTLIFFLLTHSLIHHAQQIPYQAQYLFQSQFNHSYGCQNNRLLVSRSPIRITIDTSLLTNTLNPNTSTPVLSFIMNSLSVAQQFIQNRIMVNPEASISIPVNCLDVITGSSTRSVSDTDLFIYATSITSSTNTYTATGKSCAWSTSGAPLPDMSFRYGRPTVGRIKFNTYPTLDNYTLSNRLFATLTANILREMIHILGFDSSLYGSYLNPQTGNVYSTVKTAYTPVNSTSFTNQRPALFMIKTTNVVKQAQIFFGCDSLAGMQLQNQGQDGETGTGWQSQTGSHWQRSIMYDEVMTITDFFDAQKRVSVITYALLQDMGWYKVDMTFNDTSNYGYKKGCDFVDNICYSTNVASYNQFCSVSDNINIQICTNQYFSKGYCSKNDSYTDKCGIWIHQTLCVDNLVTDGYQSVNQEVYGTSSFCVQSTLSTVNVNNNFQGRCYPYICNTNGTIAFTIGSGSNAINILCNSFDTGIPKYFNGLKGSLTCPNYIDFCINSRKLCPNWCNQNGICTGGICNCKPGYSGSDCSINVCNQSPNIYYDTSTSKCASSCQTGYYINIYDFTCLLCSMSCTVCAHQPDNCTNCANNYYLYISSCVMQCPNYSYLINGACQSCDTSCLTCTASTATDCTSCPINSTSQTYLNPTNACLSTCIIGQYTYYNTIDRTCVKSCPLTLYTNSSNYCIFCPDGSFSSNDGNCINSCLSTQYQDSVNHICKNCSVNCNQCSGPLDQNCLSCNVPAYWFISICVLASECPNGTFPDQSNSTSYACTLCDVTLNCYTCDFLSGKLQCLTCKFGYFFTTSNNTCNNACPQKYFANNSTQTCLLCASPCKQCSSLTNNSCLSCENGYYYLNNATGGYCIQSCSNAGAYYINVATCVACYTVCKTCNGNSISNCLSCITGMYLYQNHCYYTCPQGTYRDNATSSCKNCDLTCTYCFGSLNSQCFNCTTNYVLDNTTCKSSCSNNLQANQYGICSENTLFFIKLFLLLTIQLIVLS